MSEPEKRFAAERCRETRLSPTNSNLRARPQNFAAPTHYYDHHQLRSASEGGSGGPPPLCEFRFLTSCALATDLAGLQIWISDAGQSHACPRRTFERKDPATDATLAVQGSGLAKSNVLHPHHRQRALTLDGFPALLDASCTSCPPR